MKKTIVRSRYSRALIVPLVLTVGMVLTLLSVSATYAAEKKVKAPKTAVVFGPEYYLQPSSSGLKSARNVIVMKEDQGGTGGCQEDVYVARVYLTNTDLLPVKAFPPTVVVPDEIYIFGFVCAQRGTATVIYQSEYVYALPADPDSPNPQGAWESIQGTELNEDFDIDGALDDNNNSWDYAMTYTSNPLASSHMSHQVEIYREGNKILIANNFSAITSRLPFPLEIGPPLNKTFENVIVATHGSYGQGPGGHIRFQAQGVGPVQIITNHTFDDPVYNNQTISEAIYYRIDGVAAGSLAGTPFDGGASDGLWFTP